MVFSLIIFLSILLIIFYQDLKERKVNLILLLLSIGIGGFIYFKKSDSTSFFYNISLNTTFIISIGFTLFLYTKLKLKKNLFETIGIGDFLFFLVFVVSFPTYSFLILFSCSLIFSLVLFLLLKPKLKHKTVPLAGFQALFLAIVLVVNSIFKIVDLYA